MGQTRIALDVMGGDRAPVANLSAALMAVADGASGLDPDRIVLVGREDTIRSELERQGGNPGFEVLHASDVIDMHEKPGKALRSKPDSSIAVCTQAVTSGEAGAFVSIGNTGAVVGAATHRR